MPLFRRGHGVAGPSQLHLLVLPLSLSAHYHVSTHLQQSPPALRLLPAATILVSRAAHPLSGRHLNLALLYISCDARVDIKRSLPLKPGGSGLS